MNYFVNKNLESEAEYMHKCDFMQKVAFGQVTEETEPEMQ